MSNRAYAKTPHGKAVLERLSDGEWHRLADLKKIWVKNHPDPGRADTFHITMSTRVQAGLVEMDGDRVRLIQERCARCDGVLGEVYGWTGEFVEMTTRSHSNRAFKAWHKGNRRICPDCVAAWLRVNGRDREVEHLAPYLGRAS